MKSKLECLTALQRAMKYGNLSASELSALSKTEIDEYNTELNVYWSGGVDDASRDQAQSERLTKLAGDLAAAL